MQKIDKTSAFDSQTETFDDFEETDTPGMERWTFYKSGWRPALGWLSVLIVMYAFLIHPGLMWVFTAMGWKTSPYEIDPAALINLVAIVIGVGAMRTYEKVKFNEMQVQQKYSASRTRSPKPSKPPRPSPDDDIYNPEVFETEG